MRPRCSKTTKSRTFSQISANVLGSSVPSPEYAEINSWMRSASGRMASRVRMDFLADGFDSPPGVSHGLPHSRRSRAAWNIMNRQHGLQAQARIEILVERWIQVPQLFQRQVLKLAIPFQTQLNCLTNLLMG